MKRHPNFVGVAFFVDKFNMLLYFYGLLVQYAEAWSFILLSQCFRFPYKLTGFLISHQKRDLNVVYVPQYHRRLKRRQHDMHE